MQPNIVNPIWIRLIKILSPMLMMGAFSIDVALIYSWLHHAIIPKLMVTLAVIGTVVLVTHLFEGVVAGVMAKKRGLNPFRYGIYTFLVGTVGFVDLMAMDD